MCCLNLRVGPVNLLQIESLVVQFNEVTFANQSAIKSMWNTKDVKILGGK